MSHWSECKHIEGKWPVKGQAIPLRYRAHIQAVPGRTALETDVDDIHIEIDPTSVVTPQVAAFLDDKRNYHRLASDIINGEVLTRYLMEQMQPKKSD